MENEQKGRNCRDRSTLCDLYRQYSIVRFNFKKISGNYIDVDDGPSLTAVVDERCWRQV